MIPPRPLLWSFADALTASNEIIYDEQPRLVFRFEDDTVPNECGYFEMDSDQAVEGCECRRLLSTAS